MPKIRLHENAEVKLQRLEWRRLKQQKRQARDRRSEKRLNEMQEKYDHLRMMENRVREEGREDFSAEEIYYMLMEAYYEARKGKRDTYDVLRVELNIYENVWRLAQDIADRSYRPSRSEAFIVSDPVMREIFAASFRDRIVHHLLINICMPWWNRFFIRDAYSCRVGKGTDYGVKRAAHHIAVKSDNYRKPTYFVKMDIKGFFMSMDREKLMEMAVWGVHEQFPNFGPLGRLAAFLWRQVIQDNPLDGVQIRGKIHEWNGLPRDKSLFFQPEGRGIVIGNLTSQLLSNIFLDSLDKFIVYQLGYHHYGRYVDDFYVVVNEDELDKLAVDVERIREYLLTLGLTLHPHKTQWIDVKHGVKYLGKYIKNGHIEMDKRFNNNYYGAVLSYALGLGDEDSVISYMGGCMNYGCRKMQEKIWNAAGMELD